jgi:hypothetical protein
VDKYRPRERPRHYRAHAMSRIDSYTPSSIVRRRAVLTFVGLAGTCAALSVLFLSMRAVMDVGGVCASGNTPFEPRVQCPSGVPGLMFGSVFGGLIALGTYAVNTFAVNLTLLAWPALFLSLGFNFMDYGITPPPGFEGGVAWAWIACGIIFLLMGGVPLVIGIGAVLQGRESRMRAPDQQGLRERLRLGASGAPEPDTEARQRRLRTFAIGLQAVAVVAGLLGGMELFEWATGSSVSFGFR